MAIGRAQRRERWRARVVAAFGESEGEAALDILELVEFAWHDCYGELAPPDQVIEDVLVCANSSLVGFTRAAHLAIRDWRDLRRWADDRRSERAGDDGAG